jgi:hypothetical protein
MSTMRDLHDLFLLFSPYFMAKMTPLMSYFSAVRRNCIMLGRKRMSELAIGKCSCFVLFANKIIKKGTTCAFWASIRD